MEIGRFGFHPEPATIAIRDSIIRRFSASIGEHYRGTPIILVAYRLDSLALCRGAPKGNLSPCFSIKVETLLYRLFGSGMSSFLSQQWAKFACYNRFWLADNARIDGAFAFVCSLMDSLCFVVPSRAPL